VFNLRVKFNKHKIALCFLTVVVLIVFHTLLANAMTNEKRKEPIMKATGWNQPEIISSLTDGLNSSNHRLIRDDSGRVHSIWISENVSYYSLEWQIFENETWSKPQSIMNSTTHNSMPDYEAIIDSNNRLHIVWSNNSASIFHKFLEYNTTNEWSKDYIITDKYNYCYSVVADNRERIYCVYFSHTDSPEPEALDAYSLYFNGSIWTTPERISRYLFDPDNLVPYYPIRVAIDTNDKNQIFFLYTAQYWDIDNDIREYYLRFCFYNGLTWSNDILISTKINIFNIDVAFDNAYQAHIFYMGYTDTNTITHKVFSDIKCVFTETVTLFEKTEFPTTEDFYSNIISFNVVIAGSDIYLPFTCLEYIFEVGFDQDLLVAHYRGGWTIETLYSTNESKLFIPKAVIDPNGEVYITTNFSNESSNYPMEIMFFYGKDLFIYAPTTPYKTSLLFGPMIVIIPIVYYYNKRKKNMRS
jgi:hypothetical protein